MPQPDEYLLGFARALRAAGLRVTQDRATGMLQAVAAVGLDDARATYWAARSTVCSGPEDLLVYDRVFESWFHEDPVNVGKARPKVSLVSTDLGSDGDGAVDSDEEATTLRTSASDTEVLRQRDIADLSASERATLQAMFAALRPRLPTRAAYRRRPWRRGVVDRRTTLRRMRGHLGEPVDIAWQHRGTRHRRVVLLIDVSGSMSPYADALLRLAHRLSTGASSGRGGSVETFTLGTRLTRVSRAMHLRDPDKAIAAAGEVVPDWSGGTRLGETIKAFLDRWGQRGMARGAVVVVFSDGWERGDASLLATQMQRLGRLAHAVVWVNPHKGSVGYQPVQLGMAAALPHCDRFVAGHSLAAFDELLGVVAHA